MTRAHLWFPICGLGLLAAGPAPALDLPVRYPDREAISGPAYRGDALEISLAPAAARAARRARPAGAGESAYAPSAALGIPALDRVATALGGARFEREFPGESAPAAEGETDFTAFFRVRVPPGVALEDALARFRALPEVASADPIAVLPVSAAPNDSLYSSSWWYFQPSRADIKALEGWSITTGDTAIVVAIIDTGVLPYHPDLGGAQAGLRGQMWTNWREQGGVPFFDDDGNGYVDDVAGWDFVEFPSPSGVTPGEDWQDADPDPTDFAGHGTMVAGLVGAITDNSIGVAGTAWQVRLMPLRIGWSATCSGCAGGLVDMSFAASAIRYATRAGASVINCSFETITTTGLTSAASAAVRAGVTIVMAAGNSGQYHELQDRDDVLAVAATEVDDLVAEFSNLGSYVDLAAPGENLTSTYVVHAGEDSIGARQPAYASLSGTSLSAPLVAGAVALVQSRQRALGQPPLTPQTMVLRMRETTDDISAANPGIAGYGTGRLDLGRALEDPPTSWARRLGATASLAPVVLTGTSGRTRIVLATGDRKIVLLDALNGDTIAVATLPSAPTEQIAAADLGGGYGVGLFVGTLNGKVAGFDPRLGALPNWPVSGPSTIYTMDAGPALGDLDGDGVLEIVSGSFDGNVWAWHPDGSRLDAFPVSTGSSSLAGPIALGDLDGEPGVEIVAASRDGSLHVIRWDGNEPNGWPVALGAPASDAPIILRLGHATQPSIVVCAGGSVKAFAPDGTLRWSSTAGGSITEDPAAGDLDGDGADEIVLALPSPAAIGVLDSTGGARLNLGWPRLLAATPAGPPLIGWLAPGAGPGVYVYAGGTQVALSDSGNALPEFPKPGGAGLSPTLAELDGDGRTELIAGTASDSVLYVYDAGPGTWSPTPQPWGTARANFARTGSRLYAPPIGVLDDILPATITSLTADSVSTSGLVLHWVAPGDDGALGRASAYQIQVTTRPAAAGTFSSGGFYAPPPPDTAGRPQRFVVQGLAPNTRYFFAARARDDAGNWGLASNLVRIMTPLGRARAPRQEHGQTIALRAALGTHEVALEWQAPEADAARRIEIFDVGGRRLRRLGLGAGEEGTLRWDGRDESGRRLPAGIYFARLTSGSLRAQARVVLIP
ncbi:MAG TPA: S8 family serine peptidase [Candidatus Eisenbacteria bacterium]|jgi:subtilisin family serine protease